MPASFLAWKNRVSTEQKYYFLKNLSSFLSAGVSLQSSLEILILENQGKMQEILKELKERIEKGERLYAFFSHYPQIFDEGLTLMVQTGEESGCLPQTLKKAAQYLKVRSEFKQKIIRSLAYPILVSGFSLVVLGVLVFTVFPVFGEIFLDLRINMPFSLYLMLWLKNFISQAWVFILLVVLFNLFLIRFFLQTKSGKEKKDIFLMKFKFFRFIFFERFFRILAYSLEAGLPIMVVLNSLKKDSSNLFFQGVLAKITDSLLAGSALSQGFAQEKFFPSLVVTMIKTAEEAGDMDKMFLHLADYFEEKIEAFLGYITMFLEPAATLGIGAVIFSLAVSIFSPLMSLMSKVE